MASFYQGQALQFPFTFTDETATPPVLINPASVYFRYGPDGKAASLATVLTYSSATVPAMNTIARTATGTYVAWIDTTAMAPGIWWAAAQSTGSPPGLGQDYAPLQFTILAAPV